MSRYDAKRDRSAADLLRPMPKAWCCAWVWLVLAVPIAMTGCRFQPSHAENVALEDLYERDVRDGVNDLSPVRGAPRTLRVVRGSKTYRCTMCHNDFAVHRQRKALEGEHSDIIFEHGRNVNCIDCHNPARPQSFRTRLGDSIPADKPSLLCGECHTSIFDEWKIGAHGRVNGYWNPDMGPQNRLDCTQCHAPHRPKFEKMVPEAPPVLSRFTGKEQGEAHHEEH